MGLRKMVSDLWQYFDRLGIDWLMGSVYPQQSIMRFQVTATGTPMTITFSEQYIEGEQGIEMADTTYGVWCDGETSSKVTVDQDTKTTGSFDILNATAAEVVDILVIGRTVKMPVVND
jgi:hypothetical protein